VWELIYNHYAVLRGLPAPYTKKMTELVRPETGSWDHFGYGTLTFTLRADASPLPPHPVPPVPEGLSATGGVSQVFLRWEKSPDDSAQGYVIQRAVRPRGPFEQIASWNNNTDPQYTDTAVSNGEVYYYIVAATNQAGVSGNSKIVAAQPLAAGALPSGWTCSTIGNAAKAGTATYSTASENTFVTEATGGNIGGTSDSLAFVHRNVTNDFVFIARLIEAKWTGRDKVGLMVRDSLKPGAKAVALTLGEIGGRQCRFGARAETSAKMNWQPGCDYTWLPVWFKIERAGDVFTGYQSVDGVNWFKAGSAKAALSSSCLVGLAATTGSRHESIANLFDHVSCKP
jgi:regulation of enolase protein 1 (concanavalin A-like superfamily)